MTKRSIEAVQVGEEGRSSCYGSCCDWLKIFLPREKETMVTTTSTSTTTTTTTKRKPHSHAHECRSKSSAGGDSGNNIIFNLITGEIFETLICSRFLLPEDIASLLQVDGIFNSYMQLRKSYCKIHGTKLDLTYEDDWDRNHHRNNRQCEDIHNDETMIRANDISNNDVQFLIWSLQQQAFISAAPSPKYGNVGNVNVVDDDNDEPQSLCVGNVNVVDDDNDEPQSLCPDCLDCRMARFNSEKKCPCCKEFIFHKNINTACGGKCQKIVCEDCGSYSCEADHCDNMTQHCDTCFDGYWCECCDRELHEICEPSSRCGECSQRFCSSCTFAGCADIFTCYECRGFFCVDCKDWFHCSKCKDGFCMACKDSLWCVFCEEFFCRDCEEGIHCSLCGEPSCSECKMTFFCNGCNTFHCKVCRDKFSCKYCQKVYCNQHENHSNECEGSYRNVLIRSIQRGSL